MIQGDEPVLARGKLDVGEERAQVILDDLKPLNSALLGSVREVHIRAPKARLADNAVATLKDLIGRHAGKCLTYLHVGLEGEREAIFLLGDTFRVSPNEAFVSAVEGMLDAGSVDLR